MDWGGGGAYLPCLLGLLSCMCRSLAKGHVGRWREHSHRHRLLCSSRHKSCMVFVLKGQAGVGVQMVGRLGLASSGRGKEARKAAPTTLCISVTPGRLSAIDESAARAELAPIGRPGGSARTSSLPSRGSIVAHDHLEELGDRVPRRHLGPVLAGGLRRGTPREAQRWAHLAHGRGGTASAPSP